MSLQILKVKSEVLKEGTWNIEEDGRLTLIKKSDNPLIATGAYFELTLDKEDWKRLRAEIDQALLQTGLIDIEKQDGKQEDTYIPYDERENIVQWLARFCRHIDNGDMWLTDADNLEFFKKKMRQQFGWDTDDITLR